MRAQTDGWMDGWRDKEREVGEIEGKMPLNAVFPPITIKHGNVMIDGLVAGYGKTLCSADRRRVQ